MIHVLITVILATVVSTVAVSADVAPRIAEGEVLRGHFIQERHLRGFAAPLRSEGQFLLAPGRGLIWKTETPFAVTTVITESGLIQEVNGNRTLHMPAARLPFLSRLYRMLGGALAGDWQGLEDDFTLAREGSDVNWRLNMTPKKTDEMTMPFRSIIVTGKRFVDQVTLSKPDDDFDQLTFLDQVLSSTPLSADDALALSSVDR